VLIGRKAAAKRYTEKKIYPKGMRIIKIKIHLLGGIPSPTFYE
jgi:hypothetical protein